MMTHPPIIIIFLTYQRTEYAIQTIQAARANLQYPGEIKWIVADDGSEAKHLEQVIEQIGTDNIYSVYSHRVSYGRLANWAWAESAKHTPITLWLEDDWTLKYPFDPSLYVKALVEHDHLGMIRIGPVVAGLEGVTEGYGGQMYLRLYKSRDYYFSGNPSIRHSRFFDAYGAYPKGLGPGDTEVVYDIRVRQQNGPHILVSFDVGTWGAFHHIGIERSY